VPAGLLTPPLAGFFGKLPVTGDFVSRGLPPLFQRRWDGWVTQHVAPRLKDGEGWPRGGLRFRLVSGGKVAAGVMLPGRDAAGRRFPFSALLIGAALPGPEGLDPWCDACADACRAALAGDLGADDLWDKLDGIPAPEGSGPDTGLLLWSADRPPTAAEPEAPVPALDLLFAPPLSSG
jgi:type VI secretion system protein ImpM